jgi:hypothetical protein
MNTRRMNPYGQLAWDHWKTWRPNELAQILDPQEYFSRLGLQVETQIELMTAELAGNDSVAEDYLAKVGRLRMARFTAQAQVLRELVLLPAEPGHPEYDPPDELPTQVPAEASWLPVVMTEDHPNYHDFDDDPGLRKTYLPDPLPPVT